MMTSSCLVRHLLLAAVIASAASLPFGSSGQTSSKITFVENRYGPPNRPNRPNRPHSSSPGGSVQFGETSAISNQHSTGNTQTNEGQATAVSVQQQSGLGGATQTTNNQGVINALQQAQGGGDGTGTGTGGSQSSNNQVNINSSQLQQNVEGTLVNVNAGNQGVVIVNTNDPETGIVTGQKVVNNLPIAETTADSATCLYTCRRSTGQLYCCDFGKNRGGPPEIHGGHCPPSRLICPNGDFFRRCAHDGQCAASDKCCYDACANHHICKPPQVA